MAPSFGKKTKKISNLRRKGREALKQRAMKRKKRKLGEANLFIKCKSPNFERCTSRSISRDLDRWIGPMAHRGFLGRIFEAGSGGYCVWEGVVWEIKSTRGLERKRKAVLLNF